jgi:hypothetical protein
MDAGPMFKFDNIFNGLITCYVLSIKSGWTDIFKQYVSIPT